MKTPDQLSAEYIVERWPRVFHMAEAGSWDSIRARGLLSTTALLDLFDVEEPWRTEIEATRRPESVEIVSESIGRAWIRDNKPINEAALERTLRGMSLDEWYRTLNGRVFFWLTRKRLDRLRTARAYRDRKHDILTIDTAALMRSHRHEIELCPLNSGAVHGAADYFRGAGTFCGIRDYPWLKRLAVAPSEPIVELTVPYAVNDIEDLVIDVVTE